MRRGMKRADGPARQITFNLPAGTIGALWRPLIALIRGLLVGELAQGAKIGTELENRRAKVHSPMETGDGLYTLIWRILHWAHPPLDLVCDRRPPITADRG
jgi:hypothetical protein